MFVRTLQRNAQHVLMVCSDTSICIVKIFVHPLILEILPISFVNTKQRIHLIILAAHKLSIETLIQEYVQQFQLLFVKPTIKNLECAQHVFFHTIYTKESAMSVLIQQQQTSSWTLPTKFLKFAEKAKTTGCFNVIMILLPLVEMDALQIARLKTDLFVMEALQRRQITAFDQTFQSFFTLTQLIIIT